MQLHLEGSNSINAPRERVFELLTDPVFLSKSIPDAEEARVIDSSSLEARVKLKIALVSSAIKLKLTVTNRERPSRASLLAEGTGSGSTMRITSLFSLVGGSPTAMSWSADAEIGGVMAGLGSTLLKGFASKKVAEIFDGITKAVEASAR